MGSPVGVLDRNHVETSKRQSPQKVTAGRYPGGAAQEEQSSGDPMCS